MELAGLHAEIDALEAADLSGDPAVLGAEILELERAVNRLMAQKSRRLGPFDRAGGFMDAGQTTTRAWIRTQTLASRQQAASEANVARVRERLPVLFAAWEAGQTTFEHVRTAEVGLRKLPQMLWPEVDGQITAKARVWTTKDFGEWLRELAQSLGKEPKRKDETQRESRRFSVHPGFGGMSNVHGLLTPEVAEKLHAALSAASRPDASGEIRTPNQRKADALETVLDTVLDSGALPQDGGQKPHLTLTVDLDRIDEDAQREEERSQPGLWTLSAEQRAELIEAAAAATDATVDATSGRPRYYWTGPASVAAARRLCCEGQVLPIFTRNGRPIDVGRHTRMVSAALRAFILARDQHCRWPGCEMPGRWTQVHHVQHWRDGGRTDRENLVLLCDHHHHAAHDGRWTVILLAPGQISVRPRTSSGDPLYEIRIKAPPPRSALDINTKLRVAAERARASSAA